MTNLFIYFMVFCSIAFVLFLIYSNKRMRKLDAELTDKNNSNRNYRFEKWEDTLPYLGKPIVVCLEEMPNVTGIMEGISLVMSGDKIIDAHIEIKGQKWEFWRCKPASN